MPLETSCQATASGSSLPGLSSRYRQWSSPSIEPTGPKRTNAPRTDRTAPTHPKPRDPVPFPNGVEWGGFNSNGWRSGQDRKEASAWPGDVGPPGPYRVDRPFSDPFPCVDELRVDLHDYLCTRGWNVSDSTSPAADVREPPAAAPPHSADPKIGRFDSNDAIKKAYEPIPGFSEILKRVQNASEPLDLNKPLPPLPIPPVPKRSSKRPHQRAATVKARGETNGMRKTVRQSQGGDI